MAQTINCDLCSQEPAVILQSSMADGSTVGVGDSCMAAYIMGMAQACGMVALPAELVPADLGGSAQAPEVAPEPAKATGRKRRPVAVVLDGDDQADIDAGVQAEA